MIVLKGGLFLFTVLLALISAIGIFEFYKMAMPERRVERLLALLSGSSLLFTPIAGGEKLLLLSVCSLFLSFSLLFLFRVKTIETTAHDVAFAILAFLYIPFSLMHLVLLRQTEYGIQWLFVLMLIVMTNDSAAYYFGCRFGKHRLYPLVSPKKSIEGAVGGLLGSLGGTLLAKYTFFTQLSFFDVITTAIFIGIVGQAGDLFESLLKRSFGVKDSGTIIPGHGGVLDRMDSILFAAPVTYYYAIYLFQG